MKILMLVWMSAGCALIGKWGLGQEVADARALGMAGISSVPGTGYAIAGNPAWWAGSAGTIAGITSRDKYLLKEMKDVSVSLCHGWKSDALGISITMSGLHPYLKQQYELSYSREFAEKVHSGIGLVYIHFNSTEGTSAVYAATFRAGLGFRLSEKLWVSFYGLNPLGLGLSSRGSFLIPCLYLAGLAYQPAETVLLAVELASSNEAGIVVRGGMEYQFRQRFFLRAGCSSHPFRVAFGTGFTKNRLHIDLAAEYHSYLGLSPALSLNYRFGSLQEDEN